MLEGSCISVVVPTYNSEPTIGECLKSIVQQPTLPLDQIIVVDGGSQDKTLDIAKSLGVTVRTTEPNRSRQRNQGAIEAPSSWILFVDSDMVLDKNVIAACDAFIETISGSVVAAVVPEQSVGRTFWAKSRAFERSFYEGIWWIEAARLVHRPTFLAIEGYDEFLGQIGGEDGDLDSRLREQGEVGRVHGALIYHSEENMSFKKLYLKKRRYGPTASVVFEDRNKARAQNQLRLGPRVGLFFRKPLKLLRHPILFSGVLTIGAIEYYVLMRHRRIRRKESLEKRYHVHSAEK